MVTQEIGLLLSQGEPHIQNGVSNEVLKGLDNVLLAHKREISSETFGIYKKFEPMKVDIPEHQTIELFSALNSYIKEKFDQKQYADALLLYRFWIVKSKLPVNLYNEIANVLFLLNEVELSKDFINLYEVKESNLPLKYLTLGNFYNLKLKDYKSAIKYYEAYLKIDETKSVIYTILANLYSKAYGELSIKDQIYYFEKAYKLKPNDRLILHGLAFAYEKLPDKVKARYFYELLLLNNPTETDFYNYGAFLISCGEFEKGHKYFTHRFNIDDINLAYPIEQCPQKRWDLQTDISDKTLLIHYEQGFGDTFMYCRFLPQMRRLAKKIIFVVQDELYNLIKNSNKISEGIEVISSKTNFSELNYDYHMALLDVCRVLNTSCDNLPLSQGYLNVEEGLVSDFAQKHIIPNKNLKIGIAYHGNKQANYNGRDVDFSRFQRLFDIDGVDFYSFSMEKEEDNRVNYLFDSLKDFTQTACALKNMDLVITTDNVILNLSGALGVETIGLYNKHPNYRWFKLNGDNVGWYCSVKPMQVEENDCWTELFEDIKNIIVTKTKV